MAVSFQNHLKMQVLNSSQVYFQAASPKVAQLVVRGLEDRFAALRADVARDVSAAVRETKEHWAAASRRLAALEAWPQAQASLTAEMQHLRTERQEERASG